MLSGALPTLWHVNRNGPRTRRIRCAPHSNAVRLFVLFLSWGCRLAAKSGDHSHGEAKHPQAQGSVDPVSWPIVFGCHKTPPKAKTAKFEEINAGLFSTVHHPLL